MNAVIFFIFFFIYLRSQVCVLLKSTWTHLCLINNWHIIPAIMTMDPAINSFNTFAHQFKHAQLLLSSYLWLVPHFIKCSCYSCIFLSVGGSLLLLTGAHSCQSVLSNLWFIPVTKRSLLKTPCCKIRMLWLKHSHSELVKSYSFTVTFSTVA